MRFGAQPWSQATDWPGLRDVALAAERAGWDAIYTWDHLMAIQGPWRQPIFEGWAVLAAWAVLTERIRVGLMVGANTFRNPGHTAKLATTLDQSAPAGRSWRSAGRRSSASTRLMGSTSGPALGNVSTASTSR
jgi:alkanesulfonate monooxygenase SsuD/methylene tetrahydromethanopterin reductase-like flavin-dependent oxidoreductase (luciferase family)